MYPMFAMPSQAPLICAGASKLDSGCIVHCRSTVRIVEPGPHSLADVFDRPSSERFDGQRKYVANAAFGQDDARRVWIGLQLAPQAQYLNVDTAIEDIFVDAGCLQKVLAGERSLRSIEKRNQKRVFGLGQCNRDSARISEAPDAPVKLPAAKSAAPSFPVALDGCLAGFPPAQHCPDARQKLSQTERLRDVVVGARFQPDDPVDLVAT